MKTKLLSALTLLLACLELHAQFAPATNVPTPRRPQRYGITNNVPRTPPRYIPPVPNAGMNPQAGAPGNPGGPGANPGGPGGAPGAPLSSAYNASPSFASSQEEMIAPGLIDFEGVDISQVLDIYAKLVNRTLLRAALPQAQIILKTQTPLTKTEAIQALQAVLALNGVSLVNIGDKFVKVLPSDQAGTAGGEVDKSAAKDLPNLGSYVTHVVQLKYVKPTEMVPIIQPFSKLANSILAIDSNGILVLRDYAENVKRMLEMINQVDVSVPAEYISEVIPIRYAKVDDIASALNALGGGGGATVSIGSAPANAPISGLANRSGFGGMNTGMGGGMGGMSTGMGGMGSSPYGSTMGGSTFGGQRTFGGTTPNGTPSSTGTSFQDRLRNIINSTSRPSGGGGGAAAGGGQQEIQLFGQTKIIPNESGSSLLIYATRADMDVIKGIIAKLDVPLAQVLIEAVIIDVTLGNTFNFGVSAAQNPVSNGQFIGGGGVNNGQSFANFLKSVTSSNSSGFASSPVTTITSSLGTNGNSFASALPGGVSYFANIGPNWDVAVTAAESDSHASIIQRPRIQTSQAQPAQFFVGDTVPYVTSSYGGYGGYGYGNSYSQLSVGVELDVTPFINPEGMVSMQIQQEIDDLNGYTAITGVGNVPNTIKRTLNAYITVRDRDTVMLGGFIKSDKSHSKSGVPFLQDIPLLGNLFTSRSDSKGRQELIVLMRPTVLQTPELAAKHTITEEQRLPAVSEAAAEDATYQRQLIEAQRKREERRFKTSKEYGGFFVPEPGTMTTNSPVATNSVPPGTEIQEEINPLAPVAPPQTEATPPATNDDAASSEPATPQQKSAAALAQKMMELNASTNSAH